MPDDPTVDVATFYAMYEEGTWKCLTLGTYVFAEQYDAWGIPENLRK
jgi:hypothetical protein